MLLKSTARFAAEVICPNEGLDFCRLDSGVCDLLLAPPALPVNMFKGLKEKMLLTPNAGF